MGYETVLEKVGEFGLYQKLLCAIFVFYTTFIVGVNYYSQVFIFETPPHRCSLDNLDTHLDNIPTLATDAISDSRGWQIPLPWLPSTRGGPSQCSQYDLTHHHEIHDMAKHYISNINVQDGSLTVPAHIQNNIKDYVSNSSEIKCKSGWHYDHTLLFKTITSENDWVCDEDWRNVFLQTMFWVGNTVGCFLWGYTNDKFGRRPTIIVVHTLYFIGGILTLAATNFYFLVLCRFLVGCAHHTVSHLPYLLVVEYCGVSSRTVPLLIVLVSNSIGSMTVPWIASFFPSWHYLAAIAAISALPVLAAFKLIPESPSWLVLVGRDDEAITQLTRVARVNKKPIEESVWRQNLVNEKEIEATGVDPTASVSLWEIVKVPRLRVNALLVNIICMMGFMCYYGNVQNTGNLATNVYMSYFLGALVEIPCWLVPIGINKLGRRIPLFALFLMSGVCGVAYGQVPTAYVDNVGLALALLGRMCATASYFICLQYASEIFPTVIRGQGVAMAEIFGSAAIFISPSIVYLKRYSSELPLLILGVCSIIGSAATFFLPETAGKSLPQTLEEARAFGEENKITLSCFSKKKKYVLGDLMGSSDNAAVERGDQQQQDSQQQTTTTTTTTSS